MKKIVIFCAALACFSAANAQVTASSVNKADDNNSRPATKPGTPHTNEFSNMEMNISDGVLSFSGVPDVAHSVYAIVTDADGQQMRQARLTPAHSTMSIQRLHKGLYFITIMYRNQSKKGFTVNL